MSMNILIVAKRKVSFKKKNGKRGTDTQTLIFDAWQTPTKTTYEIAGSADPAQAYIDWVMATTRSERVPVYSEHDMFCDGPPVMYEDYHPGREHVIKFTNWLAEVDRDGYTVAYEVI